MGVLESKVQAPRIFFAIALRSKEYLGIEIQLVMIKITFSIIV